MSKWHGSFKYFVTMRMMIWDTSVINNWEKQYKKVWKDEYRDNNSELRLLKEILQCKNINLQFNNFTNEENKSIIQFLTPSVFGWLKLAFWKTCILWHLVMSLSNVSGRCSNWLMNNCDFY